ncbi:MAG: lytic murein transglycosylase B [Gammaproteobacteria bacterium]|nr:MAG: lytic murein transglycosylase B [Gammaproteobacteria bacterium]
MPSKWITPLLALAFFHVQAWAIDLEKEADVEAFVQDMAKRHRFDPLYLRQVFKKTAWRPEIVEAMKRPAEAKPWYQYRPLFITAARIRSGRAFLKDHDDLLRRAEDTYGVPASVIVAILGIETRYGRYTGRHRVMDALTTLGFRYPKRGRFFRSELEQFLLMTREEGLDPLAVKGSYAGAMGWGQFIPSSFRHYSVDFDGDGRRDLWHAADAIGSIAHYLSAHGWEPRTPVAMKIQNEGNIQPSKTLKPQSPLRALKVSLKETVPDDLPASILSLEGEKGPEYWVIFNNFYVITRYNHSPLYAMAVHQLAQAVEETP